MLATAADPTENSLAGRAYVNFNFGGNTALPKNFHYGMRLDYDQRFTPVVMPSMLQLDFKDSGFNVARLNGLPVVRRVALNQVETIAVGGAASASTVTVVDWALVAVGVAGVGVATASAVDNSDEGTVQVAGNGQTASGQTTSGQTTSGQTTSGQTTSGQTTSGQTTSGTTEGGTTEGGSTTGGGSTGGGSTTGGSTTGGSTSGIPLLGLSEMESLSINSERLTRDYVEWLDGGNGQMGDLSPAR